MPTFDSFQNQAAPRGYIVYQIQQAADDLGTIGQWSREAMQELQALRALAAKVGGVHPDVAQEMTAHIAPIEDRIDLSYELTRHVVALLGTLAEPRAEGMVKRQEAGDATAIIRRTKQEMRREQVVQLANDEWQKHPKYTTERIAGLIRDSFKKKRRSVGLTTIKDDIAWGIKAGVIKKP